MIALYFIRKSHGIVEWQVCSRGALQEMLKDTVRTETYMQSMLKNKHLFKDKVEREQTQTVSKAERQI